MEEEDWSFNSDRRNVLGQDDSLATTTKIEIDGVTFPKRCISLVTNMLLYVSKAMQSTQDRMQRQRMTQRPA
jgi:hypothetical protein